MHKKQNLYFKNIKKTLFNKDLFLTVKYWYIEDFRLSAILLSKMPV